jgi:hypothetical protein
MLFLFSDIGERDTPKAPLSFYFCRDGASAFSHLGFFDSYHRIRVVRAPHRKVTLLEQA